MPHDSIVVRGAREHNLKNIDVVIPRDKLVVITGVSGSGKSSLAFDTIYAEGQRRYVESLSAYARQFLGLMEKPDVDYIDGLSPAISIDQKGASRNPRSTVATQTEIYDYLRLLYARVGPPTLPELRPADRATDGAADRGCDAGDPGGTAADDPGARRAATGRASTTRSSRTRARRGFVRVRVDGRVRDLDEEIALDKNKRTTSRSWSTGWWRSEAGRRGPRLSADATVGLGRDGAEAGQRRCSGRLDGGQRAEGLREEERMYSEHFACAYCGLSFGELEPRNFSFNSPHGACRECTGLGVKMELDPEMVIPNKNLSLAEGALQPWSRHEQRFDLVHADAGRRRTKHSFSTAGAGARADARAPEHRALR